MVILLNKTGNQTWIDGITDINAQSLNNIENAINDIEESKISFPNDYNAEDGSVLIKSGNSIVFGDVVSADNFYNISKLNEILYGERTNSSSLNDFTDRLLTENKNIAAAINELLELISASVGENSQISEIKLNIKDIGESITLINKWISGDEVLDNNDFSDDTIKYKHIKAAIKDILVKIEEISKSQSSTTSGISSRVTTLENNYNNNVKPYIIKNLKDGTGTGSFYSSGNSISGNHSYAIGEGLTAQKDQFVLGKYNSSSSNAFIIGNGSSESSKSNSVEITKSGDINIRGVIKDLSGTTPNSGQVLGYTNGKMTWRDESFNSFYKGIADSYNTNKNNIELVSNFYKNNKTSLDKLALNETNITDNTNWLINNKTTLQAMIDKYKAENP